MTAAIICPKHPMNTALLTELVRITCGKVLKIIGSGKKTDLSKYDRVIIVYQYSLSSVRDEFIRFLENSSIKNATLVIDVPEFYIESDPEWADRAKELISFFNTVCEKGDAGTAAIDTGNLKGSVQRKYAEELGAEFLEKMNETVLSKYSAVTVFNARTYFSMNISSRTANLYIIAGILAVPAGMLLFYSALKYSSPLRNCCS